MKIARREWDVVVVGGGPGGSTCAALLARAGVGVLVIDRDEFPRPHVGESLLPRGIRVHDSLGLTPDPDAFVHKQGAQFVCERTERVARFDFAEALEGGHGYAWHSDRGRYDKMLLDHAVTLGAQVVHGVSVARFDVGADVVDVETSDGALRARFVIDASGQERLVARMFRSAEPYGDFGKAAVFTAFHDIPQAALDDLGDDNDIRVIMLDDAWAWAIPLPGARLSVGLVSQKKGITTAWLDRLVDESPLLSRWTKGARRDDVQIASNFCFRNARAFGSRYACVGDAACFLDPVFSSGVTLAMVGAEGIAEVLAPALERGDEADESIFDEFRAEMDRAYETFAAFVYRFYNRRIVENLFFGAPPDGEVRAAVTSVLAGDVWRRDNPFQEMLLRSRLGPRARAARSAPASSGLAKTAASQPAESADR